MFEAFYIEADIVIEDVFEVGMKRVDPATPAPPQIDYQLCVGASFGKQGVDIVAGLEKCRNTNGHQIGTEFNSLSPRVATIWVPA